MVRYVIDALSPVKRRTRIVLAMVLLKRVQFYGEKKRMKTHVVGSQLKALTGHRSHECQLARKQPWTRLQKQSPDVAA